MVAPADPPAGAAGLASEPPAPDRPGAAAGIGAVSGASAAGVLGAGGAAADPLPGPLGGVHLQPGAAPRDPGNGPGDGLPDQPQGGTLRTLRLGTDSDSAHAGHSGADRQGLPRGRL